MAGEEHGLLGVGAVAAGDHERDAVVAGGALPPGEGAGDVRPHPLALSRGERAGVATARAGERARRRELRLGARLDRRAAVRAARGDLEAVADRDADADGRERATVGEEDIRAAGAVRAR